jgi:hypothetical protein
MYEIEAALIGAGAALLAPGVPYALKRLGEIRPNPIRARALLGRWKGSGADNYIIQMCRLQGSKVRMFAL